MLRDYLASPEQRGFEEDLRGDGTRIADVSLNTDSIKGADREAAGHDMSSGPA